MSTIACAATCGPASSPSSPRDLLPEIPSIRTMPMIGTQFRRVLALAALSLATASPAAAAPDVWACQRYRTELANLNASASTSQVSPVATRMMGWHQAWIQRFSSASSKRSSAAIMALRSGGA